MPLSEILTLQSSSADDGENWGGAAPVSTHLADVPSMGRHLEGSSELKLRAPLGPLVLLSGKDLIH